MKHKHCNEEAYSLAPIPRHCEITSTEEDVASIPVHDADEALVVTMEITGHDVRRVLLDIGSFVEIPYYDAFKKMGLKESYLSLADMPLVGFNSP